MNVYDACAAIADLYNIFKSDDKIKSLYKSFT